MNETQYNELFTTYRQRIFNFAARRIPVSDAEDITAETFLRAWAHRDQIDELKPTTSADPANNWLHMVAKRLIIDWYRKRATSLQISKFSLPTTSERDFTDSSNANIDIAPLLPSMTPRQRSVIVMRSKGFTNPEIALMMHVSLDAVKQIYKRGIMSMHRAQLRAVA